MFDRVAGNWRRFGETEPYWSVLTNPVFLRERFDGHANAFFDHGRLDVDSVLGALARAGRCLPLGRVLDFGCGVGRLSVALAPLAESVVGLDISPSHLAEAGRVVARRGLTNVALVQLEAPEAIEAQGRFDLIVSLLVLQHNPPPVMAWLYVRLLGLLNPGGVAFIQIATWIPGYRFVVGDHLAAENVPMEMNALPQREVFRIIAAQGCEVLEVRDDSDMGLNGVSQYFVVQRPAD